MTVMSTARQQALSSTSDSGTASPQQAHTSQSPNRNQIGSQAVAKFKAGGTRFVGESKAHSLEKDKLSTTYPKDAPVRDTARSRSPSTQSEGSALSDSILENTPGMQHMPAALGDNSDHGKSSRAFALQVPSDLPPNESRKGRVMPNNDPWHSLQGIGTAPDAGQLASSITSNLKGDDTSLQQLQTQLSTVQSSVLKAALSKESAVKQAKLQGHQLPNPNAIAKRSKKSIGKPYFSPKQQATVAARSDVGVSLKRITDLHESLANPGATSNAGATKPVNHSHVMPLKHGVQMPAPEMAETSSNPTRSLAYAQLAEAYAQLAATSLLGVDDSIDQDTALAITRATATHLAITAEAEGVVGDHNRCFGIHSHVAVSRKLLDEIMTNATANKKGHQGTVTKTKQAKPGVASSGMDSIENSAATKRKRQRKEFVSWSCSHCGTNVSLQRRRGPSGSMDLCNKCGVAYLRRAQREERRKEKMEAAKTGYTKNSLGVTT